MTASKSGPDRAFAGDAQAADPPVDAALRPKNFDEYVGQSTIKENLRVFVQAARQRGEPVDHVLFCGPPGLGKTSLAHIVAAEMGTRCVVTSGPALEKKGDLAGILTSLEASDLLFIDEIHRLSPTIEENLYPAMEEFRFDIVIGEGAHARTMTLPLPPFTLVGATTRSGLVSGPLRDRFGYTGRLDFYSPSDLEQILARSAMRLGVRLACDAAAEVARRCRGTPRVANRFLRRLRDFAEVMGTGEVTLEIARKGLSALGVDTFGLDEMDRRLLVIIVEHFEGGPVGLDTMAASVGEEPQTLEDVYEPYLIQQGFLKRTPRGRVAMPRAYEVLGRVPK
ncbi:MAG: Holliday junction branch migration DNA helicase RuvB [Myxococcota bacterium]